MQTKANKKIKQKSKPVPAQKASNLTSEQSSVEAYIKKNPLFVFTLAEILLIIVVFHKFLLFQDMYLFKDIGSDSVNQIWPFRVHLSEYLHNMGFPKWSFNEGVGKNFYPISIYPESIGDPFNIILCFFPKDTIPYGTILIEVLKIYLGGLFFFLFLRTLKFPAFTSIIGGLSYSFSGFMILGSGFVFSTETLYAAVLLYCLENFLRYGKWYLVPVPFFLIASLQPFLLYLYGLLLIIYCVIRVSCNEDNSMELLKKEPLWQNILVIIFKAGLLSFAGIIMSSFNLLSNIDLLLHNPRGLGGEASVIKTMLSSPIFSTANLWELTTSLYRFFSNDLNGTGSYDMGWGYYIDGPTLYTGLITCLLMPQSFFLMKKRERTIFLVLTILCILPHFFPFLRHALWLFSGEYYRTYSLFLSMLLLMLCLKTLAALDSKVKINILPLLITLAVLLILLFYPFYDSKPVYNQNTRMGAPSMVNNNLRLVVAVFLLFYTCLIYLFNIPKFRNFIIPILGITIFIELAYFSYPAVNNRPVVSNRELHEKVGYNDYTLEALAYINANDATFFRVGKEYGSSPSLNRNVPYNDGLIQNYKSTASYDSFNQLYYCNFLNELNVPSIEGFNYRLIGPLLARQLVSDILSEKYILVKQPYRKIPYQSDSLTTIGNVTVTRNKVFLPFGYTYQNFISLTEFRKLSNMQKDIILFRAFVADSSELPLFKDFIQLNAKDSLPGNGIGNDKLMNYANELRKYSISNLVYNQNMVKGNIKLSRTKLLFLTIPYDRGWQFKVDGNVVKPIMANIGFMGVILWPGKHSIELNYEPPYLKLGCYISGFSVLGYFLLVIRFRRKGKF